MAWLTFDVRQKKMIAAFTLTLKYVEVRKHWWFIEPDDLTMLFIVFASMSLLWLLAHWILHRKRKPMRLPVALWVGFGCAAVLLGLAIIMSSLQGPTPMELQSHTSAKKEPNKAAQTTAITPPPSTTAPAPLSDL